MKTVCASFLLMTAFGTVLILALYAAMRLFGKKLTAFCRYSLWRIALVLLLLPLPLLSPMLGKAQAPSLIKAPAAAVSRRAYAVVEYASGAASEASPEVTPAQSAAMQSDDPTVPSVDPTVPSVCADAPSANADTPDSSVCTLSTPAEEPLFSPLTAACIVWAVGAVTVFAVFMIRYASFAAFVRNARRSGLIREADGETKALYDPLCKGIKNPPRLLLTKQSVSPVLCGFFRRSVILPDEGLDPDMISSVLSHELVHHRRGDTLWKLAAAVVQSVFWFDPAVYLASRELSREAEFSCDEAVVDSMTDDNVTSYCEAMLRVVKLCKASRRPMLSPFYSSKTNVKERIFNIMNENKKHKGAVLVALVLALCILTGAAVAYATPGEEDTLTPGTNAVTDTQSAEVTDETEVADGTETQNAAPDETETVTEAVTEEVAFPVTEPSAPVTDAPAPVTDAPESATEYHRDEAEKEDPVETVNEKSDAEQITELISKAIAENKSKDFRAFAITGSVIDDCLGMTYQQITKYVDMLGHVENNNGGWGNHLRIRDVALGTVSNDLDRITAEKLDVLLHQCTSSKEFLDKLKEQYGDPDYLQQNSGTYGYKEEYWLTEDGSACIRISVFETAGKNDHSFDENVNNISLSAHNDHSSQQSLYSKEDLDAIFASGQAE